jgi:hypothetical protein
MENLGQFCVEINSHRPELFRKRVYNHAGCDSYS